MQGLMASQEHCAQCTMLKKCRSPDGTEYQAEGKIVHPASGEGQQRQLQVWFDATLLCCMMLVMPNLAGSCRTKAVAALIIMPGQEYSRCA